MIHDIIDVIEINEKLGEIKQCQRFEFDNTNRTLKHRILPEHIIGQIQEFDNNAVHKKIGELEKQILNSENENHSIDALDTLLLLYDFPKWHQLRELFRHGDCFSDNLT